MTRNQVKKPLIIQLVGWALILAPIGYYVTTALQWQNWSVVVLIEQLLALPHGPLKMVVILSSPLVGLAVHSVKAIGWISFMLYCGATIFVNFYIAYSSEAVTNFSASLYSLTGVLASLVYVGRKEIMAPYFNPQMRWWESAERFPFKLDAQIQQSGDTEQINAKPFDVSVSGCFLITDHPYEAGQQLQLNLKLLEPINLTAQVIWVSAGDEKIPQGIGVKFTSHLDEVSMMVTRFRKNYGPTVPEKKISASPA